MIDENELIEKLEEWKKALELAGKNDLIRDVPDTVIDIVMNELQGGTE